MERTRLYVKKKDLEAVLNGSKLLRCHTQMGDWQKDDIVFISGEEHRAILRYVKEEMLSNIMLSFRNMLAAGAGLPLKKIIPPEFEFDSKGVDVRETELEPT